MQEQLIDPLRVEFCGKRGNMDPVVIRTVSLNQSQYGVWKIIAPTRRRFPNPPEKGFFGMKSVISRPLSFSVFALCILLSTKSTALQGQTISKADWEFLPLPNRSLPFSTMSVNFKGHETDFLSPISGVTVVPAPSSEVQATKPTWSSLGKVSPDDSTWDVSARDRIGSPNVPMDSWIYPALERLGALGLIPSQNASIRPWTRQECLRQVREVEEAVGSFGLSDSVNEEGLRILSDLQKELAEPEDRNGIVLESAYTRYGVIAGPALTDGFHFGQTWWNDFGRPLRQGGSVIAGYSVRAVTGRYFAYIRQEAQQTPGTPALTLAQGQFLNDLDNLPFGTPVVPTPYLPTPAMAAYLRQRPLEMYAGMAFKGNTLSFGKQAIFWGLNTMGPWSFSSNAEPTYNLRLTASRPRPFPFFPLLGTYRYDFVFGKLSGHKYPARPYFNGAKIDLTFGSSVEMSFSSWSILWGVGHPMTLRSLKRNLFSFDSTGTNFGYGDRLDPGDRKSGFDFRYRVPGLRNVVTVYADAYADDEPNPLDAPRRVAWAPGIYLARLPYLPHMDFRFEVASSEELSQDEGHGGRFFINNQYRDGNTNKGFLLGNAVGRDGRAYEGRTGYWFSARSRVEVGYRQRVVSENFLAGGGTTTDVFLNASHAINSEWSAQVFAQYERHFIPTLESVAHHNESGWLQITWNPKLHLNR
ncbi:Capsule assembly protein Wzi [Granulicella pectinivorans]|uniref:Capsule assembly protein Wzi n=1 Tax=Granulicella pectinivorans TaxID=474950 RepID=A0A1I6M603_9BACT|nr:capsule assembly Wzi family protein [Granulicella pectinivorans]SFS10952.1 Capsule assembly protein Wzi [Granulicella pectinivorans]